MDPESRSLQRLACEELRNPKKLSGCSESLRDVRLNPDRRRPVAGVAQGRTGRQPGFRACLRGRRSAVP